VGLTFGVIFWGKGIWSGRWFVGLGFVRRFVLRFKMIVGNALLFESCANDHHLVLPDGGESCLRVEGGA
jgi:hypothetical protein